MLDNRQIRAAFPARRNAAAALTACILSFSLTGCLSSLQKQSAALTAATTPVVDQAAAAYRSANALYDLRVDYDAVSYFDRRPGQPVYNPRDIQPLLSDSDIERRLVVLEAFQCYVRTLNEIASGASSPALDAASKSVGNNLTALGNDLALPSKLPSALRFPQAPPL